MEKLLGLTTKFSHCVLLTIGQEYSTKQLDCWNFQHQTTVSGESTRVYDVPCEVLKVSVGNK